MAGITDEFMKKMRAKTKHYCVVILRHGPNWNKTGAERVIWEHGRRNFALRRDGLLSVVCPISDSSDISGVGVFNGSIDEVTKIMDDDPGVKGEFFVYEVHDTRSFPGDCLP